MNSKCTRAVASPLPVHFQLLWFMLTHSTGTKGNFHTANQTLNYTYAVASPWHQHTTKQAATHCNRPDLKMHTSNGVSMAPTHYNTHCNKLQQEWPENAQEQWSPWHVGQCVSNSHMFTHSIDLKCNTWMTQVHWANAMATRTLKFKFFTSVVFFRCLQRDCVLVSPQFCDSSWREFAPTSTARSPQASRGNPLCNLQSRSHCDSRRLAPVYKARPARMLCVRAGCASGILLCSGTLLQ